MPFIRFHFVDAARLNPVGSQLLDRIQEAIGCPREHIVLEVIASVIVDDKGVQEGGWPLVEVDCFQRPQEVEEAVAKIISEFLLVIGYPNSDVYFRYLKPENYYENGRCYR